jgi:predicted enzyme related to lactoylglutathione lyase
VTSTIASLCIDCADADRLAGFWADVLGWPITGRGWQRTEHGADGVSITAPGGGLTIDFRWVPDNAKTTKNRLHLDVTAADGDQGRELERLRALGARPTHVGEGDVTWHVLVDPEGNEFCLVRGQD